MAEVDAGFVEVGIEAERTADLTTGAEFVSEPVQSVAQRRDGLGAIRPPGDGPGEYVARLRIESVPVERTPHREHQLEIVVEAHRLDVIEEAERFLTVSEPEERFSEPDHPVFVSRVASSVPVLMRAAIPKSVRCAEF